MRDTRYAELVLRLGLLSLIVGGLFGLRVGADRVNFLRAQDLIHRTTLALKPFELEPTPPVRDSENAAAIYLENPVSLNRDQRKEFVSLLDGERDRSEVLNSFISANQNKVRAWRAASRRAKCHFKPDLSQPRLAEYDTISDAVLILSAQAVSQFKSGNSSLALRTLRTAARVSSHAYHDGFSEALEAQVWSRLYVLKALARMGQFDDRVNNSLGPEPNFRQSLRGELVHGLARVSESNVLGGTPSWAGKTASSFIGNQLMGLWGRHYVRLPKEAGNYEAAEQVLSQLDQEVKSSRFLDRIIVRPYARLVKLAKEGTDLKAQLRKRA